MKADSGAGGAGEELAHRWPVPCTLNPSFLHGVKADPDMGGAGGEVLVGGLCSEP